MSDRARDLLFSGASGASVSKEKSQYDYNEDDDSDQDEDMREIVKMRRKAKEVQQESVSSTERSVQLLKASEQLAQSTVDQLEDQSEQLMQVEDKVDTMAGNTKEAKKLAADHSRLHNLIPITFSTLFKSKKTKKEEQEERNRLRKRDEEQNEQRKQLQRRKNQLSNIRDDSSSGGSTPPDSNSHRGSLGVAGSGQQQQEGEVDEEFESKEKQIDQNLDQMMRSLNVLKAHGEVMQDQVKSQNQIIDRISEKVAESDADITGSKKLIQKWAK